MLFQALDDKSGCIGYYADGQLIFDQVPDGVTATWDYSSSLPDVDVQYARLFCNGLSLGEACPPGQQERWKRITDKLRAFLRSFDTAKVSLDEHCFFRLVPERFLLEFFDAKNLITEHVLKSYSKPENYDFLVDLSRVVAGMAERPLNLDRDALKDRLAS